MKHILLVISLIIFGSSLQAQVLIPFTAEEGYTYAEEQAKSTYENVKLQAIGTITAEVNGGAISISFDLDNGESEVWVYSFVNADNESENTTVVVSQVPILGYQNLTSLVGDAISAFTEFIPSIPITADTWVDSDVMASNISSHASYSEMNSKYPNAIPVLIGMGANEVNPDLPQNETYWNVNFGSDPNDLATSNFICVVHVETEETQCYEVNVETMIMLDELASFNMAPMPANENLTVTVPNELVGQEVLVNIFSIDGTFIQAFKNSNESFNINTSNLTSGIYLLRFVGDNNIYQTKFVVE